MVMSEKTKVNERGGEGMRILVGVTGASGVICTDEDGSVNLHVHISLSDKYGNGHGGHLVEGTRVLMTADIVLGEIEGVGMLRRFDPDMEVFLLSPQQE